MERSELRDLLLGSGFNPREENIATPQLLLDKGVPADVLKLVGMNANEIVAMRQAANDDSVLLTSLYICHSLCWRADNQPVFAMTDAKALTEQEYELLNDLGLSVKRFLGVIPKAVDEAKNDSSATQNSDGGSASPQSSEEALPSANEASTTENSANG